MRTNLEISISTIMAVGGFAWLLGKTQNPAWGVLLVASLILGLVLIVLRSFDKSPEECDHTQLHKWGKQDVACPKCDRVWTVVSLTQDK